MNILVIGGAGYIGSHVAREFLDRGHRVTVFDNLSAGLRENLFPEARFVHGTIMDYPALLAACRNTSSGSDDPVESDAPGGAFDAAVHLAAFKAVGESMEKPEKYSLNNLAGTINILNALSESGIRRVVFSSSAAVYGSPEYLPMDENHPLKPESYYGFTKLEIERVMGWYDRLKGIRFAALRYFNAAGYDVKGRLAGLERNPRNLIPRVMEAAAGARGELAVYGDDYDTADGTCVRDYIHVSDLAAGHAAALDYIAKNGASVTVNLGTGTGVSVREILDAARRVTGRPIPSAVRGRRPGDPAVVTASSGLARELLGWKPEHSDIDTIIRTTWEAYRKNGARTDTDYTEGNT
jgi:UDP-glucose 4-epimerase